MKLKVQDIYPIANVATFETALSGAGFTPTAMACGTNGVEEIALLNDVSVFPNPAANATNVSVSLETASDVTVSIFNLIGEVVSTQVYNGTEGSNQFDVSTNNLENGQYIINVSLGENIASTQVNLNILK